LATPVKHVIAPMVEQHVRPHSSYFGTSRHRITKSPSAYSEP
jgi:hypothetical protein